MSSNKKTQVKRKSSDGSNKGCASRWSKKKTCAILALITAIIGVLTAVISCIAPVGGELV